MEPGQGHGGMIWYEGILASTAGGAPVQVELGSEISRQLNQPVQIQYGNFSSIPSQPQHIIVAHQPMQEINTENVEVIKAQKVIKARSGSAGERVPCPKCGKTFSCNANLRDHIRLHTGERPFSCTECGMSFAQRSNWRLHKRVHTGERPYMCGICGKTFARSTHLPGHMRVHTGERPFQCESCEHTFASAQALKNHVRTHTGEKPFACEFCHTSFTHSSSLSSHKKRCNGERRKRGRPLGSGQRFFKKKATPGRRGRPRKRGKFVKRGRKKNKDNSEEIVFNVDNSIKEDTDEKAGGSTIIKFETATGAIITAEGIPVEHDMMEISMEVISHVVPEKATSEDELKAVEVRPSENEGISILPDREVVVTDDMVQAAADAAGLSDNADLHQEAALTMATLQHGHVNILTPTVTNGGEKPPVSFHLKQLKQE